MNRIHSLSHLSAYLAQLLLLSLHGLLEGGQGLGLIGDLLTEGLKPVLEVLVLHPQFLDATFKLTQSLILPGGARCSNIMIDCECLLNQVLNVLFELSLKLTGPDLDTLCAEGTVDGLLSEGAARDHGSFPPWQGPAEGSETGSSSRM